MATTATPTKARKASKSTKASKATAKATTASNGSAKAPKEPKPCQCFSTPTGETADDGAPIFRACGQSTTGTYAPGHDAKLKSRLMELAVAGQEYHRQDGGILVSGDPAAMARDLNWGHFVEKAVNRASADSERRAARAAQAEQRKTEREQVKAARAAEKEAARAESKAAQERIAANKGGRTVKAKVGRQVVEGEVVSEDVNELTIRYTTKGGNKTTAVIKRDRLVND